MNYFPVIKTIECPDKSLLLSDGTCADIRNLSCPVCGEEFTHVQGVYTLIGDDEGGSLYRGSYLVARETPYRRDAIAIRVLGESCEHLWDVVFQQHKGVTIVRIDILKNDGRR